MRTRFAPSLTGYLHLGHVLHMLYVWGIARSKNAAVLCRIENHDQGRARPEYETAILETMKWLGFIPDLGITTQNADKTSGFRQSDCEEQYLAVLEELKGRDLIYGCECSRKQILQSNGGNREAANPSELCYSGTCASKNLPLEGNTVRLRIPDGEVVFRDLKRGACRQIPMQQCGDFSIRDRNGQWTYQFCCVVDDMRQNIDLVIRGEDIMFSTGRQIQLFETLGAAIPQFFHHPLVCDEQGHKLSKRQRSESISKLRDAGAPPEDIIGRAAHAGGLTDSYFPMNTAEGLSLIS